MNSTLPIDVSPPRWEGKRVLVLSPTPTSPKNYGNRCRIRRVCSNLKAAGAQITFVHYASELEWRDHVPVAAQIEMQRMWDDYYVVPPTVHLHPAPASSHHTIDEWWDPSIETMLRWLFSKAEFDIFIVNYTWLSQALTLAPPGVMRVLDTHDRFAGRKEMLEQHGIGPEFFYLENDGVEKQALDRADLVWAIKEEEAEIFRGVTSRPVVTMPYIDICDSLPLPQDDPEGALRFGVIGGNNNINLVNTSRFIDEFRRIARASFAPARLVIAGSICDSLNIEEDGLVTLMGKVDDVQEFYGAVDVICIPMDFSTGLKIKTGEALSFGLPVISTRHGFEGYPRTHPLHNLPSIASVAAAAVKLSFDRARLADLRIVSFGSAAGTAKAIKAGLQETLEIWAASGRGLMVVHAAALSGKSHLALATKSFLTFLSYMAPVRVYVVGDRLVPGPTMDLIIGRHVPIYVDPSVEVPPEFESANPIIRRASMLDLLEELRPKLIVFDTMLSDEQMSALDRSNALHFARPAMIASTPSGASEEGLCALRLSGMILPVDSVRFRNLANRMGIRMALGSSIPGWLPGHESGIPDRAYNAPDVIILEDSDSREISRFLAEIFEELGWRTLIATTAPDAESADPKPTETQLYASASWVIQQLGRRASLPTAAIDLTSVAPGSMALIEVLNLLAVPVLDMLLPDGPGGLNNMAMGRRVSGLWWIISYVSQRIEKMSDSEQRWKEQLEQVATEIRSDSGTADQWRMLKDSLSEKQTVPLHINF